MSVDAEEIWNRSKVSHRLEILERLGVLAADRYADKPWRLLPYYVRGPIYRLAANRERYGKVSPVKARRPGRLARVATRVRVRRAHDPRAFRFGVGNLSGGGPARAYLGRHVLDLGDRHAHAIVDVPWDSLKVKLGKLKAKFDPWTKALRGTGARLLAIRNPAPSGPGDRAIVEAAVHVPKDAYLRLRKSGEFDVLDDGVLARRGRKKKATNIFVMPP